jgi:hypothetical protein
MVNPNFIKDTMREMDCRFFQIEDAYGRTMYHQWQNVSLDEAVQRFQRFVDSCALNSSFRVSIYNSSEKFKNGEPKETGMSYEVMITDQPKKEAPISGFQNQNNQMGVDPTAIAERMYNVGSMGAIGLDQYLASKQSEMSLLLEIQNLKNEIRYLTDKHGMEMERMRREHEDAIASDKKIEGIIGTVLPTLGLGGGGLGLAGIPNNSVPIGSIQDDSKRKVIECVNKLLKVDPNFPDNIQKLCILAENKPTVYQMAVQQLNSFI